MAARAPIYPGLRPEAVRARAAAFERFATWQAAHPRWASPEAALEGVASLYELLPVASRARPIDPSGIASMRQALAALRIHGV